MTDLDRNYELRKAWQNAEPTTRLAFMLHRMWEHSGGLDDLCLSTARGFAEDFARLVPELPQKEHTPLAVALHDRNDHKGPVCDRCDAFASHLIGLGWPSGPDAARPREDIVTAAGKELVAKHAEMYWHDYEVFLRVGMEERVARIEKQAVEIERERILDSVGAMTPKTIKDGGKYTGNFISRDNVMRVVKGNMDFVRRLGGTSGTNPPPPPPPDKASE